MPPRLLPSLLRAKPRAREPTASCKVRTRREDHFRETHSSLIFNFGMASTAAAAAAAVPAAAATAMGRPTGVPSQGRPPLSPPAAPVIYRRPCPPLPPRRQCAQRQSRARAARKCQRPPVTQAQLRVSSRNSSHAMFPVALCYPHQSKGVKCPQPWTLTPWRGQ